MILDLHVHSVYSGDSPVTPEEYAEKMNELRTEYMVDGFALMEHNTIASAECDLSSLSKKHDLVILAGVEADTMWGHVLAYGMTPELWKKMSGEPNRKIEPISFAEKALENGVLLVPSHPFRGWIGLGARCADLPGIKAVEGLNGSDSDQENMAAMSLAKKLGISATGGSDAHFLPELGSGLTVFESDIRTMDDLVREISAGRCRPAKLEEARLR